MPLAIDEKKMTGKDGEKIVSLNPANPPTKSIPHMEFPKVLYKHPTKPFITIEHRNAKHELVEEEIVPASHVTLVVADQKAQDKAVKEGWVTKPYIPQAPPDPNAGLYDKTA